MLYDMINIRLNGEQRDYLGLIGTEVYLEKDLIGLGRAMKLDTVGGVLKTAKVTSIKRNRKNGILKIEVENGYAFYLRSQVKMAEKKPFYVVKGGVA